MSLDVRLTAFVLRDALLTLDTGKSPVLPLTDSEWEGFVRHFLNLFIGCFPSHAAPERGSGKVKML